MTKRSTILVLDDDADILRMFSNLLADTYDIFTANDTLQALNLLSILRCDLFITDLSMPLLSGIEFIRLIRAHAKYDRMPILVISAFPEMAERLKGTRVEGTLQKPLILAELLPAIEATIKRSPQA